MDRSVDRPIDSPQSSPAVRWMRGLVLAVGFAAAVLSVGFMLRWPIATQTWPVPVTPLTCTFLAAYALGLVAALVWVAATAETVGLQGIGLTTAVAFGSMSIVLLGMVGGRPELVINLVAVIGLCVGGVVTFAIGLRQPVHDRRRTPAPLRLTCLIVAGLLLTLGVPLILRVPDVMPWILDLDSGALIGGMFLGSAAYFLYGALRPEWPHASGPLAALLAYDLVLTLPLIAHLPTARPVHATVLVPYIAVLTSTAVLGAYVFLVDRRTRVSTTARQDTMERR
jgi:hypothetical protein